MKKHILPVILIFVLFLLGCGEPKIPDNIHPTSYGIGQTALEKYEEYQKGILSKDDLYDELSNLHDKLSELTFDNTFNDIANTIISADVLNIAVMAHAGTANDTEKCADSLRYYLEHGSVKK